MAERNIKVGHIVICGREIEYILERKRVKNVNLRVRPNGEVYVSAGGRVSEKYIEKVLLEKGDFILSAFERFRRLEKSLPEVSADEVFIFGEKYSVDAVVGRKNSAEIDGGRLLLTLRDDTADARERLVDSFLRERCREVVNEVCMEVYPGFEALGVDFPEIKFRKMKSRWGSCQPKKGILTFNYELSAVPIECIRYVVLHEFTHFLHPDHSAAFHDRLLGFLPDAPQRKRQLEAYGVMLRK